MSLEALNALYGWIAARKAYESALKPDDEYTSDDLRELCSLSSKMYEAENKLFALMT